jgi:anti-sigma factor RsiW
LSPRIDFLGNKIEADPFKEQVKEMKCRKSKLVSAYFDDMLINPDRKRFEAHLRECPSCTARLAAYGSLRTSLTSQGRQNAPAWFSAKVLARISAKPRRSALPRVLVRLAEVMIVLLMVTVGIVSGRFLVNGIQAPHKASFASLLSLDVFQPAPPDSVGGVYLVMTEANNGK